MMTLTRVLEDYAVLKKPANDDKEDYAVFKKPAVDKDECVVFRKPATESLKNVHSRAYHNAESEYKRKCKMAGTTPSKATMLKKARAAGKAAVRAAMVE